MMGKIDSEIKELLEKFLEDRLTIAELERLRLLAADPVRQEDLAKLIEAELKQGKHARGLVASYEANAENVYEADAPTRQDAIFHTILQESDRLRLEETERRLPLRLAHRVHFLREWGWAAASVILIAGISVYLWTSNKKHTDSAVATTNTGEVLPGKDGAILTLADGSQIVLDSMGNGVIALQNGSQAAIQNGVLIYDPAGGTGGETVYNAITTPKGRQYQVTLPDGTRVWLNAASSIRYPTVFTEADRRVQLTGEAYFEVTKNAKLPFRVNVNNNTTVEVLGTSFNVNAYENENAVNTTLLEGSVKVNGTVIEPGQQAQVINAGRNKERGIKVVNNADINKVMAWRNGAFNFENASLEEIMRQLERWYDIEVTYEQRVPDIALAGKMTRDVSLNGLLNALKKMGVHYRLEGRKLIVLP